MHKTSLAIGFLAVLLLFCETSDAQERAYCIKMHELIGKPFVYTPDAPPSCDVRIVTTGKMVLKNQCWQFSADGVCLGVGHRKISHKNHQYFCWIRIDEQHLHEPLVFVHGEEPVFAESAWYSNFWNRFLAESNCQEHIDVDGLRLCLWKEFVKVCPKTFIDTMKYEYGMDGPNEYGGPRSRHPGIDLVPGMRLRVDSVSWLNPTKNQSTNDVFKGYASAAPTYIKITRQGVGEEERVTFDPFTSHIKRFMGQPVIDGAQITGASSIDLNIPPLTKHQRLIYPNEFNFSKESSGSAPRFHVLIVGNNDKRLLSGTALENQLGTLKWDDARVNSTGTTFFTFRGRSTVTPEVLIQMPKEDQFTAIGTTLRDVLDTKFSSPSEVACARTLLTRFYKGKLVPVKFMDNNPHLIELPLLKGDCIRW